MPQGREDASRHCSPAGSQRSSSTPCLCKQCLSESQELKTPSIYRHQIPLLLVTSVVGTHEISRIFPGLRCSASHPDKLGFMLVRLTPKSTRFGDDFSAP